MGDGSGLISQLGADWGVTQMPGCGQSRHRSGMQRSLMPKQLAAQLCSWVQRTVTPVAGRLVNRYNTPCHARRSQEFKATRAPMKPLSLRRWAALVGVLSGLRSAAPLPRSHVCSAVSRPPALASALAGHGHLAASCLLSAPVLVCWTLARGHGDCTVGVLTVC